MCSVFAFYSNKKAARFRFEGIQLTDGDANASRSKHICYLISSSRVWIIFIDNTYVIFGWVRMQGRRRSNKLE